MKKTRILSSLLLVAVMCLSLVACGGSQSTSDSGAAGGAGSASGDAEYTILFMPKLTNIPYFQATNEGAQEVAAELGVEVIYDGPTSADAAEQVTMLENYIAQGVDAICIGPNDPAAVTTVLQDAKDKGILVVDWDTQADESVTDASIFNVVDKDFGEHLVDKLVEYMGTDEADIAIITGGLSAANLNAWIDAGTEYMKTEYPKLNLVSDPIPSNESQDEAYQKTKDLMTAYPTVKGILGYSSPTGPGCGKAIADLGLQDKVSVVANGLEDDCQEVLNNGGLKAACLWSCQKLGRLTIATAVDMLKNGGAVPADGATIDGWDEPIISDGSHNVYLTAAGEDYEKK